MRGSFSGGVFCVYVDGFLMLKALILISFEPRKKGPWLVGLYRDYTTQLYRHYNERL